MPGSVSLGRLVLDTPYPLSPDQVAFYREKGFVKLKGVFSPDVLEFYGREISKKVLELNTLHLPMDRRTTYQKAFLQVVNLWKESEGVREFVFGRRLARIAAELLEVPGVRLYHDQALCKESGGGFTPWHADQYYWPMSSDRSVTAWVPLQSTPLEMGPVAFAPASHRLQIGRDLAIGDQSQQVLERELLRAQLGQVEEPFELGEVSFHSGWTFHRAGRNRTGRAREVMTVIYMDAGMRLAEPRNPNQEEDWKGLCPEVRPGEVMDSPLTPVLYESGGGA
jgi:ectoine hydroxylase-related dioxygenase (phytanoyl-CoA dioxygenase family)